MANLKKTDADNHNFKVLRAMLRSEIKDLQTQKSKSGDGVEAANANMRKIKQYVRQELNAMKNKKDFEKFCEAYELECDPDNQSISDSEPELDEYIDFNRGFSTHFNSPSTSSFHFFRMESSMKTNKGEWTGSRLSISDKLSQSGYNNTSIKRNKKGSEDYVNSKPIIQHEDRRFSFKGVVRPNSDMNGKSDFAHPNPTLSEVEEANSIVDDN